MYLVTLHHCNHISIAKGTVSKHTKYAKHRSMHHQRSVHKLNLTSRDMTDTHDMQGIDKCCYNWHPTRYDPYTICSSVCNGDLVASNLVLTLFILPFGSGHWRRTIPQKHSHYIESPWSCGKLVLFHSIQGESRAIMITLIWFPGANSSSSLRRHVPVPCLPWPRWIVERPWMQRLSLSLLMRGSAVGHTPLRMSQMINYIAFHDSLTPRDV